MIQPTSCSAATTSKKAATLLERHTSHSCIKVTFAQHPSCAAQVHFARGRLWAGCHPPASGVGSSLIQASLCTHVVSTRGARICSGRTIVSSSRNSSGNSFISRCSFCAMIGSSDLPITKRVTVWFRLFAIGSHVSLIAALRFPNLLSTPFAAVCSMQTGQAGHHAHSIQYSHASITRRPQVLLQPSHDQGQL